MKIIVKESKSELGYIAAKTGADKIREAITFRNKANIILATGASQFEMLENLVKEKIEWNKVNCFHLDEYIGIGEKHHASFKRYLRERFADKVEVNKFFFIDGNADPLSECERLNSIIKNYPIDVAFIGIGENGHLAFNDPPADFTTDKAYIIVKLDEQCRIQQLGEGWFANIETVPARAISMSIKKIMESKRIICSVPDQRKALAVKQALEFEISPAIPASILRLHEDVMLFLEKDSASLLNKKDLHD